MNNAKGNAFTKLSPFIDAPTVPTVPSVAQDEQQCNQATFVASKGWETVRKRKNGNDNKQQSLSSKTLPVENRAQLKGIPIDHLLVVGYPPPFLINVSLLLECERA
ncbi:hypothetical protein NC651_033813 [Populus alba x Populus x berolinensis]|nr:hypothetical protein NC651_033813 [Populus alba x Populus x berolinensis]